MVVLIVSKRYLEQFRNKNEAKNNGGCPEISLKRGIYNRLLCVSREFKINLKCKLFAIFFSEFCNTL